MGRSRGGGRGKGRGGKISNEEESRILQSGDIVLQSSPFAFVILASHRYNKNNIGQAGAELCRAKSDSDSGLSFFFAESSPGSESVPWVYVGYFSVL